MRTDDEILLFPVRVAPSCRMRRSSLAFADKCRITASEANKTSFLLNVSNPALPPSSNRAINLDEVIKVKSPEARARARARENDNSQFRALETTNESCRLHLTLATLVEGSRARALLRAGLGLFQVPF